VPKTTSGGLNTVAIRMPSHKIAREIIKQAGVPIAAPSANISGRPSPTKAKHVQEQMNGRVSGIVLGGDSNFGIESTVLDLTGNIPMILRPGGITIEDLIDFIPDITQDIGTIKEGENIVPKSPGQKYRHYAPKAEMIVFVGKEEDMVNRIKDLSKELFDKGQKVGIMATEETKNNYTIGNIKVVGTRTSKETIATNLFNTIRLFDEDGVDIILAEGVESEDIGMAIMNRMMKASGGKIIKL